MAAERFVKYSYTDEKDFAGDCWFLGSLRIDQHSQRAVATFCLCKDKTAFDAGKQPMDYQRTYVWTGADFTFDKTTLNPVNKNFEDEAWDKALASSEHDWTGNTAYP